MGKERDKLIRRLGGVPVSDRNLTDEELQMRYIRSYTSKGKLPPEIAMIRKKHSLSGRTRGSQDS